MKRNHANVGLSAIPCPSVLPLTMHTSGIVGSSPHANQEFFTSCRGCSDTTKRFIDERASLNPTTADPPRTADEGEDEDERGDEMSEPTQKARTEKRKTFSDGRKSKRVTGMLPETDLSQASSLRPSAETQEQPERSLKQVRTAKKGVETLQDVSYLFQKGHCEHQRNGFLQLRMAGMRKSNKKKVLKKKDGEGNPHFTRHVQAALRETTGIEWNKWMKFNAGIILTDAEVRQLTEAGLRDLSDEMGRYRQKRVSTKR